MSFSAFLRNVRLGAAFISPRVSSGDPKQDGMLEQALSSKALWLTPRAVEGYDSKDFVPVLPEGQGKELQDSVEIFKRVAETVQTDPEEIRAALTAFGSILGILRPFLDDEALRAQSLLDDILTKDEYPFVKAVYCESGEDSDWNPALWVWIVVDDDTAQDSDFYRLSARLRVKVEEFLEKRLQRWIYVRFRSLSEREYFYAEPA